jgi:hypothetical protein
MKLTIELLSQRAYSVEMDGGDDFDASVLATAALAAIARRNGWDIDETIELVRGTTKDMLNEEVEK